MFPPLSTPACAFPRAFSSRISVIFQRLNGRLVCVCAALRWSLPSSSSRGSIRPVASTTHRSSWASSPFSSYYTVPVSLSIKRHKADPLFSAKGVYLLNLSRADPHGRNESASRHSVLETGIFPRMSMQGPYDTPALPTSAGGRRSAHVADSGHLHPGGKQYRHSGDVLFDALPEETPLNRMDDEVSSEDDGEGDEQSMRRGKANGVGRHSPSLGLERAMR
jgi:hypothetical protein